MKLADYPLECEAFLAQSNSGKGNTFYRKHILFEFLSSDKGNTFCREQIL
jgi:hypothetical protein